MSVPNRNTLWGRVVADELAACGVEAVCLAPGSRCTPLTVAFAEHDGIETFSHLDERSAAFFALGRARQTGTPTPLVCTSGTALANFHPAVIEAHEARVPMLLLTADRPRVLQDSGANQTIDQEKFYGDHVRAYRTLPAPAVDDRTLRSLRTALARAVATTTGHDTDAHADSDAQADVVSAIARPARASAPAGPVHLNVPFEKPLEPTVGVRDGPGAVPDDWLDAHRHVVEGRDGPWVSVAGGTLEPSPAAVARIADAVEAAERGLVVCGPDADLSPAALVALATATGFPVLADPLSGVRFGPHVSETLVCGGYDAYVNGLGTADAYPDVVLRFGASPTSKPLRHYLRDAALTAPDADRCRQFVVDRAGGWREATFTATDLVVAASDPLATAVADRIGAPSVDRDSDRDAGDDDASGSAWATEIAALERAYWELVADDGEWFEGRVAADAVRLAPDPATVVASNSMPVRDLDRFGQPRPADLTAIGNRGASGIDGVTSTALGAASATADPVVLLVGDLAFYHDMNGLLAVDRCGADATIVLVNNDGGGIFHALPIADHDTFEGFFRTPHGLDFSPTADLYGLEFTSVSSRDGFEAAYRDSLGRDGTQVIETRFESADSRDHRDALAERARDLVE